MRIYGIALTAALLVSASSYVPAAHADGSEFVPPATTGSCTFKKTEFAVSTSEETTTSASFSDIGDGGSITFTTGTTGCVTGTFFANVGNNNSSDNVVLQVLLDGNACAPLTGGYVIANGSVDLSSHAVGFFCGAKVAAGSHTIDVQWAAGIGGEAVMFQHTLEVDHK